MNVRWPVWQLEIERISPFSDEWNEGLPENFLQSVQGIVARKRAQRQALATLGEELNRLRTAFSQTLAFFHLERNCQSWSACNCPEGELVSVLDLLGQWRAILSRFSAVFPPSEEQTCTYAALHECGLEAKEAMSAIRPGFQILHSLLSEQAVADAPPQPCLEMPPSALPEPGEAAAEAVFTAA